MGRRAPHSRNVLYAVISCSLVFCCSFVPASSSADAQTSGSTASPLLTIDLSSQGFKSVSRWQETFADDLGVDRYASQFAMEFLDEQHMVVAFSGTGLVKRQPGCPPSHHDRTVTAVVMEVPSGRVLRKAEWYLHDHRRFLWRLASGDLLLRRGDVLYRLDAELRETEFYKSGQPLEWVSTTAEQSEVLLETRGAEKGKYELRSLDAASGQVKATLQLPRLIPMVATASGFPDAVAGTRGKTWLIRFGNTPKGRLPITRVKTACTPSVNFSGANTMVVARCSSSGSAYVVSSFTNSGHFLWRRHWDEMRWVPLLARSASGSRFALATMSREGDGSSDEQKDEDGEANRGFSWTQHIEVMDTASGASLLSVATKPAVFAGQSFALSPQGTQFAVLRGTSVDVYSLPKPTRDDEAKLAAVLADVPGLVPPSDESYQELAESVEAAGDAAENGPATSGAASQASTPQQKVAVTQAAPAATNPVATFRTGTQAVVLEVVVTDRKGKPVTGLKQEQFTVLEDGAKQATRFFEEHAPAAPAGAAGTKGAPTTSAPASSNTFSNVAQRKEVESSTMLMLDMLNTPMEDRQRVREEVIKFIKKKPVNEHFALCVLGNNLRLVRGFTTDEQQLMAGVRENRGTVPTVGTVNDSGNTRLLEDMVQTLAVAQNANEQLARFAANAEQRRIDDRSQQQDLRVKATFDAFEQVTRYLAGIPGRKNLVWLSSSFPTAVFPAMNGGGTDWFRQQRDWSDDVKRLTNLLAAGHVAVYPVNIRGVQTESQFEAANMQSPQFTAPGVAPAQTAAFGNGNVANQQMQARGEISIASRETGMQRASENATMQAIADQTGGKAFYGSNDLVQAVHESVQHGTSYYTVSYSPANKNYRGEFRKIKVQVAGGEYRLAYRTGYFAEALDKPVASRGGVEATLASAAMSHGAPESGQVPFSVRVVPVGEPRNAKATAGKAKTADVKVQHYVVDYVVSATQLRFTSGAEGKAHGEFHFLVKAFDQDGTLIAQTASKASSDPTPEQLDNILRTGLRMRQEADIPVRATSMRLGVEDLTSAHIGTMELALPLPVPKDEPLVRTTKKMPAVEPE